jgi:AcrR family transcriptional regulator
MPAPARTSRDAIVDAARALLEEDGLEAVTMQRVADRVGVRGPSLYKHVTDRAALIRAVADSVVADLGRVLDESMRTGDPAEDLRAVTVAYREFVHARPHGYGLLFADLPGDLGPDPGALADLGRPMVDAARRLVGDDEALAIARTIVAWAHGFLSMELAGAFRLGGDLDAAYRTGIDLILSAISGPASPAQGSPRTG